MLLAERGAPTGAYDFQALARAGLGRGHFDCGRNRPVRAGTAAIFWLPDAPGICDRISAELPATATAASRIGYGYDSGRTHYAPPLCGGTALERPASSCAMARRPRHWRSRRAVRRPVSTIDGLQGHAIALVRPQNAPPFEVRISSTTTTGLIDAGLTRGISATSRSGGCAGRRCCRCRCRWRSRARRAGSMSTACASFPLACPAGTEFANGCCVYRGCPASYVRSPRPVRAATDELQFR